MIGSATVRERRLAWSREKRPPAGGGQGHAVARDARVSAAAWATPRARPSVGAASPRPRYCGRGSAASIAAAPTSSPSAVARGPPRRRSIGRSSGSRRGGGEEGEAEHARPAQVEAAQLLGDQPPLADQERRRGAGVQGDLEALAQLRVDLLPVPAGEPGDEDDVGGAGDRQQLGRALDDPERERRRAGSRRLPSLKRRRPVARARLGPPPAPAHDQQVGDQADDRGDHQVVEKLRWWRQSSQFRRPPCRSGQKPGPRACEPSSGQPGEAPERHLRDARRQRDEGADEGQQPGEEDGGVAVALEPVVDPGEFPRADVDQAGSSRAGRGGRSSRSRR